MKLLALADMDEFEWPHGPGKADLLIACGDLSDSLILGAARAYGCRRILAVKGNHDSAAPFSSPIEDLHGQVVEIGGLRIGGFQGSWKYKPRGTFLYEQDEVRAMLATLPPADILVCHNSPRGIHDREDGIHLGFEALNDYLRRAGPRLLLHGHQHVSRETQVGKTRVLGLYGHRLIEI